MEIRANYILVGVFTLLIVAAGFGYIFWAADQNDKKEQDRYAINFDGSVSGLSVTSPVFLNGVRIGQVAAIRLSLTDADAVYVEISVDKGTPIREDSMATLQPQGVTGTSVVQISGGTNNSPMLKTRPGEGVPIIKSEAGGLQAIMRTLPQVLEDTHNSLQRIDAFFSNENRQSVTNILRSLDNVITRLDGEMDSVQNTLHHLEAASKELSGLLTDLRPVGRDLPQAVAKFEQTMTQVEKVVSAAAPGLEKFSRDGVNDFRRLMVDSRRAVNALDRVMRKMENDPRRFLFGDTFPEYDGPRK